MIELRWLVDAAGEKKLQYRKAELVPIYPYGVPYATGYRTPDWEDVPLVHAPGPHDNIAAKEEPHE